MPFVTQPLDGDPRLLFLPGLRAEPPLRFRIDDVMRFGVRFDLGGPGAELLDGRTVDPGQLPPGLHAPALPELDGGDLVAELLLQAQGEPRLELRLQRRELPHDLFELGRIADAVVEGQVGNEGVDVQVRVDQPVDRA